MIDFSSAQQQYLATTWKWADKHNNSYNIEFLQTTWLGASIYMLQESKFASDLNFLGSVWTVAKGV
jgi:hypothetical protein